MTDLPALDQPQAYVVVGPDDQRGPYTLELLISEVVEGRLNDNTPVWWPGLSDWTTMSAHGGIAAEIAARRNPAAAPAAPAAPAAAESGQQATYGGGGGQVGGGYAAETTPGQQYSTGAYQAEVSPYVQADTQPQVAQEPTVSVSAEDAPGTFATQPAVAEEETAVADDTFGGTTFAEDAQVVQAEPAEAGGPGVFGVGGADDDVIDVPAVEVTPADFAAVDGGAVGYRAAGAAEGLDPAHGMAFSELINRSRARADAAAIVEQVDVAITDAVAGAALAQGMEAVSRDDMADRHELNFRSADGTTLTVTVGRVTGAAMALRDGHVDLNVSVTSTTYAGGVDAGTGSHGEITVRAAEFGGAAIASVSLLLPLADYVGQDMAADSAALLRDLEATIASVRARLA